MVTQTWWVNVSLEKLWKRILHGGNWGGGGTRGLPLVDGRSGKHAPSWQTQSWSWRAGCAPGDCLCASDGRGADYHHHSACHRVLRGKKTEGANASRVTVTRKEGKQPQVGIWKSAEEDGDDPPLFHPTTRRQPALSTLPTLGAIPPVWTALPPRQKRTAAAQGKPPPDQRCH